MFLRPAVIFQPTIDIRQAAVLGGRNGRVFRQPIQINIRQLFVTASGRLLFPRPFPQAGHPPKAVFVTGEAGVGKSKLVAELETYARTMKIRPVNTRCVFREGTFAYRPFVEIIRDILLMKGAATAKEIAAYVREKAPLVAPHLPILQTFLSVASGEIPLLQSKDQIWEAVHCFLEAVARERTLLLFIDDLQWADEETLRLLQYLSRNTARAPVMMLGTYRPEDVDAGKAGHPHPLLEIEEEMIREGCLNIVRLERLKEADIRQMICSLFPNAEFSKAFFDTVYRESEGNPLFVMEMLKLLKLEGVIHRDAGAFRLRSDVATLSMPSRVQDIVFRRVARLDRHEREVLEIGAVEGEVFHSDTIIRCLEADRLSVLRTLQSLERDYHIIHAQEKTYRFDHAKIRETLYDTLVPELRGEYHRMIGEYLAATYADDGQLAPNIALHFLEAGEEEKSVPVLITAARRAQALFANLQAIHFYEQALRITRGLERSRPGKFGPENAGVLEGLGEVCTLIGNHDRALESFRALLLEGGRNPVWRADILQKIGQVLLGKGDHDATLAVLTEARELLDSADLPSKHGQDVSSILGKTLITRARVFKSRGEYDEAAHLIEQGLLLLGEQGHVRERADALNDLGNILEDRSEYERAQEMFRRSLTLREGIADRKGIAVTYNNLANIFCAQGDYTNAAAMFTKSLALMKEIGFRAGIAGTCNNLGTIYQDQGRSREALEMYNRGLRVREEIGDRPGIAMSYGNMGFVSLDLGDFIGAKEYLERSVRLQEEIGMKTLMSATLSWLGLAHAGVGEADTGIELASRGLTLASGMHQTRYEGIAHRDLGILLREKWSRASPDERSEDGYLECLGHLQTSLRIFEEGKFEHEAARSSLEMARLLRLRGDVVLSDEYCLQAIEVFQKLGAMGDLDRAMNIST